MERIIRSINDNEKEASLDFVEKVFTDSEDAASGELVRNLVKEIRSLALDIAPISTQAKDDDPQDDSERSSQDVELVGFDENDDYIGLDVNSDESAGIDVLVGGLESVED